MGRLSLTRDIEMACTGRQFQPPKSKLAPSNMYIDTLQNVNWQPPICRLYKELRTNLPSQMQILEGVNLHFGGRHFREQKTAFGKPCLCPRDTRHFCHFRCKALVLLVRTQIRHFRRFRLKRPLFGGIKARFTKSTVFLDPEH